jgi:hypothetical protein
MYAVFSGDTTDKFIIGALAAVQREQSTTFPMELRAAMWFIETISPKLLVWVNGNHDCWTKKVSGIDIWRTKLENVPCLFDPHQVKFTLKHGNTKTRWLVRHQWRGTSVFNPTHGIEVGWERLDEPFDIGIAGHTHIATLHREFIKHGEKRDAVLVGTYKIRDEYGRECGYAPPVGYGSGAFVMLPDGRRFWCDDVETAKDLLKYWQQAWKA